MQHIFTFFKYSLSHFKCHHTNTHWHQKWTLNVVFPFKSKFIHSFMCVRWHRSDNSFQESCLFVCPVFLTSFSPLIWWYDLLPSAISLFTQKISISHHPDIDFFSNHLPAFCIYSFEISLLNLFSLCTVLDYILHIFLYHIFSWERSYNYLWYSLSALYFSLIVKIIFDLVCSIFKYCFYTQRNWGPFLYTLDYINILKCTFYFLSFNCKKSGLTLISWKKLRISCFGFACFVFSLCSYTQIINLLSLFYIETHSYLLTIFWRCYIFLKCVCLVTLLKFTWLFVLYLFLVFHLSINMQIFASVKSLFC